MLAIKTIWSVKVFTLFPEMFPGPLGSSLAGSALKKDVWHLNVVNIRDFAKDKHKTVDDLGFGGGPGMVMRPDIIDAALEAHWRARSDSQSGEALLYMSPRGKPLIQEDIKKLAKKSEVGVLCGRFEGVDQRVLDYWEIQEVSLGDYVLSGGELAAMVLIDACVRLLPGVLGSSLSLEEESFATGLLEYPHYTRPFQWKGLKVPDVLRSGHHEKIKAWRQAQSEEVTRKRRPDLWHYYCDQRKLEKD